ncbi:MAG: homocysteine S-methyltransferase family protein, partial [Methanobacteriota archaeon]
MATKRPSGRTRRPRTGILRRLEQGPVLGDGGYLIELEKRGYVQAGPFTPEVVLEHPQAVRELHQEFLDAGAEVLQSLTFYASKEKLGTTGYADKVRDLNRAAVRLARDVAGDKALVAGNISLTWLYDPKDPASKTRVRREFDEQLEVQVREGIDFVIGETFSYLGEAVVAAEAAKATGLPTMVTMCFERNPVTPEGKTPADCARDLVAAGADIVGVNCLRDP